VFHHDGPFDALNPHRNRKGGHRAPMQAFPKDSLNNALGGSGPLNKHPDHAIFMGNNGEEAFTEFTNRAPGEKVGFSSSNAPVFDPLSRGSILHGDESMGLGTSTFLEGTPAAMRDIQRSEAEKADMAANMQRKKSLAQRFRNVGRPGFQPSGRMTNPEGAYSRRSPPITGGATSSSMQGRAAEANPFFAEFDRKGEETISVRRTDTNIKTPPSPGRGAALERRATADATAADEAQPRAGGGLMARVKSLKGGRRARPDVPPPAGPVPPGTAA